MTKKTKTISVDSVGDSMRISKDLSVRVASDGSLSTDVQRYRKDASIRSQVVRLNAYIKNKKK